MVIKHKTVKAGAVLLVAGLAAQPAYAQIGFDIGNAIRDTITGRNAPPQQQNSSGTAASLACAASGIAVIFTRNPLARALLPAACIVFKELSDRDNAALVVHREELLSQQAPVQETWTAPDSGKQVTIATGLAEQKDEKVEFAIDPNIAAPKAGTVVEAKTYVVAAARLNFRSSPTASDSSNIIGYFNADDDVEVMGRTPDGQWALVADQGVLVGYASFKAAGKDLLVTPEQAKALQRRAKAEAVARKEERARAHFTQTSAPDSTGSIRVADASQIKKVTVVASTQCKAVSATLGQSVKSETGCAAPNGQWVML